MTNRPRAATTNIEYRQIPAPPSASPRPHPADRPTVRRPPSAVRRPNGSPGCSMGARLTPGEVHVRRHTQREHVDLQICWRRHGPYGSARGQVVAVGIQELAREVTRKVSGDSPKVLAIRLTKNGQIVFRSI